jgi:predicted lipid-binding transport protein (Tim44 family)
MKEPKVPAEQSRKTADAAKPVDLEKPAEEAKRAAAAKPAEQSSSRAFAGWMGSMWLYTGLRFALFFALWGILVLVGLKVLFAALLGLVLSVPLSFVLLAKPRRAFTANLESRVDARRVDRAGLDAELDPDAASRDEEI